MKMAGVEEVEDMTGIKGIKNDVRKKKESICSNVRKLSNFVYNLLARFKR
jgi:hypothetical protein